MVIVIGVWFALAGGLAALAGLTAMRRARRLRRGGSPRPEGARLVRH